MKAAVLSLALAAVPAFAGAGEMGMREHMDDDPFTTMITADRLELSDTGDTSLLTWDARLWIGRDFNKLLLRTEGETAAGNTQAAELEALWERPVARWWDMVAGARHEFEPAESRSWLALGLEGTASYRVHVQMTGYAGEQWRTAMRLEANYDLLLTNRLILQPRMELNAYGKSDPDRGIGSGVSDLEVGLRLRYEIRREFAPYLGVVWANKFGGTAEAAQADGQDPHEVRAIAGVRAWY